VGRFSHVEGLAAQTGQRLRLRESSNDGWIALALAPEHHDKIAARALAGVMEATGLRLTEDEAVIGALGWPCAEGAVFL
jgi:hypothetical protein